MENEIQILRSLGIQIRQQYLLNIRDHVLQKLRITRPETIADEIFKFLLMSDIQQICSSFPANIQSLHNQRLPGPFFLQIQSISNIATNQDNRAAKSDDNHMFKLLLTDGQQQIVGIEVRKISSLSYSLPTGAKMLVWDVQIRRGVLLLTEYSSKVLGGSIPMKLPETNNLSTIPNPVSSSRSSESIPSAPPISRIPVVPSVPINPSNSSISSRNINVPNHQSQTHIQTTLPSNFSKQNPSQKPPPIAVLPLSLHQESRPPPVSNSLRPLKQSISSPVIDLLGSPNEGKTPTSQKQLSPLPKSPPKTIYSIDLRDDDDDVDIHNGFGGGDDDDDHAGSFTYDLCEIDDPPPVQYQETQSSKKQSPLESRLQIQDIFQSGKQSDPGMNSFKSLQQQGQGQGQGQDKNQLSEQTLLIISQSSSISPFVISPDDSTRYQNPSIAGRNSRISSEYPPYRTDIPRKFIQELIHTPLPTNTYYIEGATVGVEAIRVETNPQSNQLQFFIIIQFEEIENSFQSFPLHVKSSLCEEILNITPHEYQVMLDKLSNKSERREFKVITCTKLTALGGKFIFEINEKKSDGYVGTILSFLL